MRPTARRVIRTYVASRDDGTPQIFHGEVARVHTNRKRADVHVQELGRRVLVMQRDFDVGALQPGDSLGDFAIAFNFIGPVADPVGVNAGVVRELAFRVWTRPRARRVHATMDRSRRNGRLELSDSRRSGWALVI